MINVFNTHSLLRLTVSLLLLTPVSSLAEKLNFQLTKDEELLELAPLISSLEYKEIKSLSLNIFSKFQRDKTIFVGAGRSPTPIVSFLELLFPDQTAAIPFGGVKDGEFTPEDNLPALWKHFDFAMKDLDFARKQEIAVIDFCLTGRTVSRFDRVFQKYLDHKNLSHLKLKYILLIPDTTVEYTISSEVQNSRLVIDKDKIIFISLNDYSRELGRKMMFTHEYDQASKLYRPNYTWLGMNPEELPIRKDYLDFIRTLKKLMSKDNELQNLGFTLSCKHLLL